MRKSLTAQDPATPRLLLQLFCLAVASMTGFNAAHAQGTASAPNWTQAQFSKIRLLGARLQKTEGEQVIAGVEIVMDKGWKTYWRHPGDAGGVPPSFIWSNSKNVSTLKVLYPAPRRFRDFGGATVGYKSRVVFPILLTPLRAGDPIELNLTFRYGLCSSICVPIKQYLSVKIPVGSSQQLPRILADALSRVPRPTGQTKNTDPRLVSHTVDLTGPKPKIILNIDYAGHTKGADVFAEITGDIHLPMPRPRRDLGPTTFAIDLSKVESLSDLRNQTVSVTLVSTAGHSVTQFKIK